MCLKKLLNFKKTEKKEDHGVGCYNRVLTKENNMYCQLKGFQSKSVCKDCEEKNKF